MNIDLIPVGDDPPESVNVIIEVPVGGQPIKYEMNKEAGTLFVDRFLHTSMRYPGNYGFVPHTLSGDGDPIDVLVCNTRALVDLADLFDDEHLDLLVRILRVGADEPAMDGGIRDRPALFRVDAPFDSGACRIEGGKTFPGGSQVAAGRKAVKYRFPEVARIDEHRIAAISAAGHICPVALAFFGRGEGRAIVLCVQIGVGARNFARRRGMAKRSKKDCG